MSGRGTLRRLTRARAHRAHPPVVRVPRVLGPEHELHDAQRGAERACPLRAAALHDAQLQDAAERRRWRRQPVLALVPERRRSIRAATVLTVVIALFAAYAFARLEFRGKRIILIAVLATLLLPVYATLIPLYRIMSNLHLVNTYLGIVLVYTSGFLPLAIWIMYNYFSSVPRELEEAAFVDGATPVVTLLRVMIPVSLPGVAATAIIVFLLGWAQFIFPLVLSSDLTTQPVTVIVAALYGQRIVPFTLLNAIGVLAAALPAVIALILNRYIVQGVMAGSIK